MSDDHPRDELLVDQPAPVDQRLWSVTTIIGASSSKDALIYWAAKETAKAAVHSLKTLEVMATGEGPDAAIDWLKGARYRARQGQRTATELGTAIHAAIETYALEGVRPDVDDEIRPFLDRFDEWAQVFQPTYEAAEMTVYSPNYSYAGTCDGIFTIDGKRLMIDYKTSREDVDDRGKPKHPWPDVALQIAAYRHGDFAGPWKTRRYEQFRRRYYLLNDGERAEAVPIPQVDGGLCLYITPARCEAYPVRCDQPVFEAFLYAIERARWALGMQDTVLGPPLTIPAEVTA